MKIVGVGLNKTGTTTLGVCLREMGFHHKAWDRAAFGLWLSGDHEQLLDTVDQFDSFDDFPWLLLYREIDARFPGSKFILTRRADPELWFRSICRHSERTGPHEVNAAIYGSSTPSGRRSEHIEVYDQHLDAVREYFRDRPDDLLEVCWEEGDGWSELAHFLAVDAPSVPFPHANPTPSSFGRLRFRTRRFVRRRVRWARSLLVQSSADATDRSTN